MPVLRQWQEGYDAYMKGAHIQECPYPHFSDDRATWLRGWKAAEKLFRG